MSTITPLAGPQAVYRVNPVAKVAASMVISVALVLSLDWVSAGVALVIEAMLLPWAGLGMRRFLVSTSPVWLAAVLSAFTILLYGRPAGTEYVQFLLIHVTDGSIQLAVATLLRVLAIGLPAVVLFATIDPTDFADGLGQLLRLPARFVLGALAGLRLVSLFLEDWRSLERARRARGVGDGGRLRRFASQSFALLVLSIRRGSKLATAMEARGFGGRRPRSWARVSRLGWPDAALLALSALIAGVAVTTSVVTGHWSLIVG